MIKDTNCFKIIVKLIVVTKLSVAYIIKGRARVLRLSKKYNTIILSTI